MYKKILIKTWNEFHDIIENIKEKQCKGELPVIYRGLADADNEKYKLSTTLERYAPNSLFSICDYASILKKCSPKVESFSGFNWNLPGDDEWKTKYSNNFENIPESIYQLPFFEFWIHVRHLGFPSPLLDWSASPYIAAYFAFQKHFEEQNKTDYVAIYAYYIESKQNIKMYDTSTTQIRVFGEPEVRTHKRHYLQQTWYTLAYKKNNIKQEDFISGYEDFLKMNNKQDVIIKIIIPRSERIPALKYLYEHNINQFSLMNSEDSLLATLAFEEFEINVQ